MVNVLLVIFTSLISGLLATLVTILCQKKSEEKQSKRNVFETLMSYRYNICDEKNVAALNKIDIVFHKNLNVTNAYKEFKTEADNAALNLDKPNQIYDKHLKILEEMAKTLGYKNINWEIIKSYYLPQALSSKIQEEALLRKQQLQNVSQENNSKNNIQVTASEQLGMQVVMKLLDNPNGINTLLTLADKFGDNKSKNKHKETK